MGEKVKIFFEISKNFKKSNGFRSNLREKERYCGYKEDGRRADRRLSISASGAGLLSATNGATKTPDRLCEPARGPFSVIALLYRCRGFPPGGSCR